MLKKIFAKRRKRRIALLLIIIPFIVLAGIFGFFGYKSIDFLTGEEEESNNHYIESMNYRLRNNATEYQIQLFDELKYAIEDGTDEVKIAELVVQNFVADFYTWTNKNGSYDVGGVYYIYSPDHRSFSIEARDNFYKYLSYYISEYGSDSLLEVTSTTVEHSSLCSEKYTTLSGTSYKYFDVVCSWTYNDYTFDRKTDYIHRAYFYVVVNEDGRFEIVQFYEL